MLIHNQHYWVMRLMTEISILKRSLWLMTCILSCLAELSTCTDRPRFSIVTVIPLPFYERPTLVPIFANQKIWGEFSLLWKQAKSENGVQCVRAVSHYGDSAPEHEWHSHASALGTTLSIKPPSIALSHVLICALFPLTLCVRLQSVF